MLVSHRAKFVFVHVQKTAGISMETVLKQNFPDLEQWHGRHGHASDAIGEWGRERWEDYYSFAFVRNPWERLVSWYSMIRARQAGKLIHLPWPLNRQPRIWSQVARKGQTFEQFLDRCTDEIFDRGCWKSFAYNQIDYLTDENGEIVVDTIGRFENIAEDSRKIFGRIGIDATLPSRNTSKHGHYSDWYDDRTEQLVRERFARDIAAFDYEFERPEKLSVAQEA